jgi:hypothetical protein
MNRFATLKRKGLPIPRIHPLWLSLTATYYESETAPNISSVCEDDPRALRSNHYISPNDLPPLDIHFKGEDGAAQSLTHDSQLMSAASCSECIASKAQETLPEVGDATQNMLPAACEQIMTTQPQCHTEVVGGARRKLPAASSSDQVITQCNTEEVVGAKFNIASKGKKRPRAFSSGTRRESLIFIALSH